MGESFLMSMVVNKMTPEEVMSNTFGKALYFIKVAFFDSFRFKGHF